MIVVVIVGPSLRGDLHREVQAAEAQWTILHLQQLVLIFVGNFLDFFGAYFTGQNS